MISRKTFILFILFNFILMMMKIVGSGSGWQWQCPTIPTYVYGLDKCYPVALDEEKRPTVTDVQ